LIGDKPISYEKAKEMARHNDPDVRRELATRQDINAEILFYLADDPSPDVRREIAQNMATPSQADLLLAGDQDQDVRSVLAGKVGSLAPGLTADERDKVRQATYDALEMLARDQVTRVRQIIAETLKDMADAPPEVIRKLARDAELVVSGPVLEFSPVLTDDDLLEIIESDYVHGALSAISRRAEVSEPIVDAIVAAGETEAVTELLSNPSTQIREETLDFIIDRAPDVAPWHRPLVQRPRLPAKAARKIARFVADNLLKTLTQRDDLPKADLAAVRDEVHRRLEEKDGGEEKAEKRPAKKKKDAARTANPVETAKTLNAEGNLTEETIAESLENGEDEFVVAALAVLSRSPLKTVQKAVETKSTKGLVALTWKAGLNMPLAYQVQLKVAHILSKDAVRPKGKSDFPLSENEMNFQLDFLKGL